MSSRSRRRKVDVSDSGSDDDDRVLYFVPSQDIDIEVLVHYLRKYLGNDSDAEPGQHPKDPRRLGYFVRSRKGLSTAMMTDLKDDSARWTKEKKPSAGKKERRIRYEDSKTATRRAELGPSGDPSELPKTGRAVSVKPEVYAPTPRVPTSNTVIQRRETDMLAGAGGYQPLQSSGRSHQDTVPGQIPASQQWNPNLFTQQDGYAINYSGQQPAQGRSGPAYNTNILVNASFQNNPNPNRHGSPGAQGVLPSIEERSRFSQPPPYDEDGKGGNQPPTTGTHGFSSMNPTAGSRHDNRQYHG